jgi:hypothetical protein
VPSVPVGLPPPPRFGSRPAGSPPSANAGLLRAAFQSVAIFRTGGESVAGTTREGSIYFDGPLVCVSRLGAVPSLIRPLQPPERGAALSFATFNPGISAPLARSDNGGIFNTLSFTASR